jgi:hypothetical protein
MMMFSKYLNIFNPFARKTVSSIPHNSFYFSICCIVKDENEYLEEWIRYHLTVGAAHFFIYDNGSEIPVKDSVQRFGLDQYVTIIDYPGKNKHVKAYNHCLKHFGASSKWIAFIDVDEFLVPKNEEYSLPEFLKDYEPYGGLGVNWLIFGSSGRQKKSDLSQLESFTLRSEPDFLPNSHIKSIVQPKYVKSALKSHCFIYVTGQNCVNENFEIVPDSFSPNSTHKIQLNHYYCRSLEEYHAKIKRGISDTKRERKLEEFHYHNEASNKVEDTTILEILRSKNQKNAR